MSLLLGPPLPSRNEHSALRVGKKSGVPGRTVQERVRGAEELLPARKKTFSVWSTPHRAPVVSAMGLWFAGSAKAQRHQAADQSP
jgi:hypothetical protein